MAGEIVRRQVRFLAAVVLIPLLMGVSSAIVVAQETDPSEAVPEIPTAAVDVEGLVGEIVRDAERIEDSVERFRELSTILFIVGAATAEQRRPIVEALEETARRLDDPLKFAGTGEGLVYYAPALAIRLASRSDDERLRDAYYGSVVRQISDEQPERAKDLIEQIANREKRAVAIVDYAKAAPVAYEEIKPLLEEAAGFDWNDLHGNRTYNFGEALSRFGGEHPAETSMFVREHFEPRDAIWVLARMTWLLSHRLDAPEAARTMVEDAQALIPQTDDTNKAAMKVIGSGHASLTPAEAEHLFDTYILPAIDRGEQKYEEPLALLANVEMSLLVSEAEAVGDATDVPLHYVLPKSIRPAANGPSADRVIAWLESQPPSMVRDKCVAEVAGAWTYGGPSHYFPEETLRQWLEILAEFTAEIDDEQMRWRTYGSLLTFAHEIGAPMETLREGWWPLHQHIEKSRHAEERKRVRLFYLYKLPLDEQKRRLADSLDADPDNEQYWKHDEQAPWTIIHRIRYSSLTDYEKEKYHRQLAEQAGSDPVVIAEIASALAVYNYPDALKLIWTTLPETRDLEATGGMYPYPEPPQNAAMALYWLSEGRRIAFAELGREGEQRDKQHAAMAEALWSLANRAPEADRDALFEELSRVLTEQGDLDKALGVARRIEDVTARMRCLGAIVAVASGATQEG